MKDLFVNVVIVTVVLFSFSRLFMKNRTIKGWKSEQQVRSIQLSEIEQTYRAIVEHSEDFILAFDADGVIKSANQQLFSVTGFTTEQLIGKKLSSLLRFVNESEWTSRLQDAALNMGLQRFEMDIYLPDNQLRSYSITILPMNVDGEVQIKSTFHDITDWKQKREIDEGHKAKSQILTWMSHEIRKPINAIIGLNYLLQQTQLTDSQKDYIGKSILSAKSLLNVTNEMLDLSKIEVNKVVLEQVDFDLYQVIKDISDMISMKAFEKGLKLHLSIHHQVPQMLSGDPFRLKQILLNLTNNALMFTESGGFSISVDVVSKGDHGVTLKFNVCDTGVGMTAEQKKNLFNEFTQADMSMTRKYGGTGLGLVISKNLVELMGGSIEVESEVGKGSCFSFTAQFNYSYGAVFNEYEDMYMKFFRVLIICDNSEMQLVLKHQFEQFKFIVGLANSEKDAIENLQNNGRYDLVMVDWKLSGTDVDRLAERIKMEFSTPRQVIVLISAYHELDLLKRTFHSSAFEKVIHYPISHSQLFDEVVALFQPYLAAKQIPVQQKEKAEDFDMLRDAVILLVEDNEINQIVAKEVLKEVGMIVDVAVNGEVAVKLVKNKRYDAILMDLQMPEMDGYEALKRIRELDEEGSFLPVLVVTADISQEARQKALQVGANDFITKPFDKTEMILRINNQLKTRFFHLQLQKQKEQLEERVWERTADLEKAKFEILNLLARASEFRDDITGQHTERVGRMSGWVGRALGLPESEVELLRLAAPLHDLGKIGIPDEILLMPGRFTEKEFAIMKNHTLIGASILKGSSFPVLRVAEEIAVAHHEKWDGTGYPKGLQGEEIPMVARIVAIVDFYDALTHERPYKSAWSVEETIAEIERQRGYHFDPQVVDAFFRVLETKVITKS